MQCDETRFCRVTKSACHNNLSLAPPIVFMFKFDFDLEDDAETGSGDVVDSTGAGHHLPPRSDGQEGYLEPHAEITFEKLVSQNPFVPGFASYVP
jgi:hypothetical protein